MDIKKRIQQGKLLSTLSTFGIGGKARYFIEMTKVEEAQQLMRFIAKEQLSFWVMGKGSNTLFDDRGFDGLVVHNKIETFSENQGTFEVGAGYNFSLLGVQTARKGWGGLEFASGIPGTVGGAVFMNAGASGQQTADSLISVSYVDEWGQLLEKNQAQCAFAYRTSCFHKMKCMIVGARFDLKKSETARKRQLDIVKYRSATQPYGEKSAGCAFQNTEEIKAGQLIEECGLKGKRIRGAEVSTLHANFIVNKGRARAQDVIELIEEITRRIYEKTGKTLNLEMRLAPYRLGD